MIQPETLQSLIDRLKRPNINVAELKDIQIKAAELIKQLFPSDYLQTVYQINLVTSYGKSNYESIAELKSILEAKLENIVRLEQARQQVKKTEELQRQRDEEKKLNENAIRENESIIKLQNDLSRTKDDLQKAYAKINEYKNEISSLGKKANKRYYNHFLKNLVFWGVIIAACGLFLGVGFYWGYT